MWPRLKRAIRSVPEGYVAVFIATAVAAIGIVLHGSLKVPWLLTALIAGIILSLAVAAFQTWLRYRKDSYDPTLALHYEKVFDEDMKADRSAAARVLRDEKLHLSEIDNNEEKEKLEAIDPVLDFLDTLGFYMKGDQISDAVMHQHFYYWIRGYWLASRTYIEAWRSKPHEVARWEHISTLFNATCQIECSSGRSTPEREDGFNAAEFLEEEIRCTENR